MKISLKKFEEKNQYQILITKKENLNHTYLMRKPTGWSVYVVHSPDRKISTRISKVHKFLCHAYEKNLITKQSREK